MNTNSEPIRIDRRLLVAGALALLILGVGIGRWTRGGSSGAAAPGSPASTDRSDARPLPLSSLSSDQGSTSARIAATLQISSPPLREANLVARGHALAEEDLDAALRSLATIPDPVDRTAFLQGVFASAAAALAPQAVLEIAAALDDPADRGTALREIAATWTSGRTRSSSDMVVERFGTEIGLGLAIAWDEAYRPELGEAWLSVFGEGEGRGVLLGSFAAHGLDPQNPERSLAVGDGLKGWDREVFLRALTASWADREPGDAWAWATGGNAPETSAANFTGVLGDILRRWAGRDLDAAKTAFDGLTDSGQRTGSAAAIARAIAIERGTVEAVDWANALPAADEKDAAHSAIAETAPQGIGVALSYSDGFATVSGLIPRGAADRSGQLQEGDRIVEVDPGTGRFEVVYGRQLQRAMELIRGDSGSTMRLRVLRRDGDSGSTRDRIVELRREQIVLQGG